MPWIWWYIFLLHLVAIQFWSSRREIRSPFIQTTTGGWGVGIHRNSRAPNQVMLTEDLNFLAGTVKKPVRNPTGDCEFPYTEISGFHTFRSWVFSLKKALMAVLISFQQSWNSLLYKMSFHRASAIISAKPLGKACTLYLHCRLQKPYHIHFAFLPSTVSFSSLLSSTSPFFGSPQGPASWNFRSTTWEANAMLGKWSDCTGEVGGGWPGRHKQV